MALIWRRLGLGRIYPAPRRRAACLIVRGIPGLAAADAFIRNEIPTIIPDAEHFACLV